MRLLISRFVFPFFIFATFLSAEMTSRTKVAMGTFVTISLEQKNKNYIQNGFDIIRDVELSLSSYNPKAIIYELNQNKRVSLDKYTYEAFVLSKKYYELSDGYFNIAIGSVTKDLYRFGEEQRLPSEQELAKSNVKNEGLYFNTKTACLLTDIKIDLGGMGKGFAVDKLAKYFALQGIQKAIIAASGDIRCLDECEIDVAHPFTEGSLLGFTTKGKNIGVSTSGTYNRYVKSTKNHHLINPKLKKPQTNFLSITLVSRLSSSDLDALATAASVMPLRMAYSFLDTLNLAYIVVQSDKTLKLSENISDFTKNLVFHDGMK